ncbi:hypothetical protein [Haloarcula pellucida]|uniref:hypothetical protein n=1 Tax=Haloarcula pellucida TaxID=1427151 RepID=UPI0016649C41|nr:hypothetical protein [Halomicroarcula pellucida]MBX0347599.1 hypothetical protein [Halomicroarcula pellucida]
MLRRDVLRAGATAGVVAGAGCLGGDNGPVFWEGFEDGLGGLVFGLVATTVTAAASEQRLADPTEVSRSGGA